MWSGETSSRGKVWCRMSEINENDIIRLTNNEPLRACTQKYQCNVIKSSKLDIIFPIVEKSEFIHHTRFGPHPKPLSIETERIFTCETKIAFNENQSLCRKLIYFLSPNKNLDCTSTRDTPPIGLKPDDTLLCSLLFIKVPPLAFIQFKTYK